MAEPLQAMSSTGRSLFGIRCTSDIEDKYRGITKRFVKVLDHERVLAGPPRVEETVEVLGEQLARRPIQQRPQTGARQREAGALSQRLRPEARASEAPLAPERPRERQAVDQRIDLAAALQCLDQFLGGRPEMDRVVVPGR